MAITFTKTTAVVARGRGVKPIPPVVLEAIEAALNGKTNVEATMTAAEGKELQNGFNRLRRQGNYKFTVSIRPAKKAGMVDMLLADVSRLP